MIERVRRQASQVGLYAGFLLVLATSHDAAALPAGNGPPLPASSAGVFIGIEKFSYDFSLQDVAYAVNDAVDLAYAVAIERGLVPANRVLLLLAGEPGPHSRDRLDKLIAAGARRQSARQADIYSLVKEQSRLVGEGGVLLISIATHGFRDGAEYLLMAEDSLLQFGTGVTADNLLQATEAGSSGLRLLILDACREQLVKPQRRGSGRGGEPDHRSVMLNEFVEKMASRPGYAVFSAASEGEYALARDGNGFFTRAILDGLRCKEGERLKTLAGLSSFVRSAVKTRSGDQQHPELRVGGGSGDFVLVQCDAVDAPVPTPVAPPSSLSRELVARIEEAKNLFAVGGPDNVEQSFRLYKQAFQELPPAILATLNQGLVARVQQLEDDSRADEGVRLYRQLLDPLITQSRRLPPKED